MRLRCNADPHGLALDTSTTTDWPFWNPAARPKCAVTLSAAYNFADLTPRPGSQMVNSDFVSATQNFVNSAALHDLEMWSPISQVTEPTEEKPFVPLLMINSWFDNPPAYHQIVDMICALTEANVSNDDYRTLTIPNSSEHAFEHWDSWDGFPTDGPTLTLVKTHVIGFLDQYLK